MKDIETFIKKYWPFLAAILILWYFLRICKKDRQACRAANADAAAQANGTVPAGGTNNNDDTAGTGGSGTGNTGNTGTGNTDDCWYDENGFFVCK